MASFLIWVMFAGLLVLWIIDGKIKKEQVLHALLACLFAYLTTLMIKELFPTLRPFEINGKRPLTITVHSNSAFPSSHAAVAFALSVTVWLHSKKNGIFFILSAILVGLGRVLGNVHYYIDILGGAVLGSLIAILVERFHLSRLIITKK